VADDLSFIDEELKKRGVDPQQALLSFVQPGAMSRPQLPAAKALQRAPETPAAPEMAQGQTRPSGGMLSFANAAQPAAPAATAEKSKLLSFAERFPLTRKVEEAVGSQPNPADYRLKPGEGPQGWKKWLDVAGQILSPRIERAIPGSRGNLEMQKAQQFGDAKAVADQKAAGAKEAASVQDTEAQTAERVAQTEQIGNKPERPEDKKIDEYVNAEGKRTLTFQRADGTVYDRVGGQTQEKPAADANKLAGEIEAQVGPKPVADANNPNGPVQWNGKTYPNERAAQVAWGRAAERIKNNEAAAGADARGKAYGANRPMNVLDTWNGNRPVVVSAKDAEENPQRYVTQAGGAKALAGQVTVEDIEGALNNLKETTKVLDGGSVNRAAIASVLADPKTTTSNFLQSEVAGTLNADEQDYVIAVLTAREVVPGIRNLLGTGAATDSRVKNMLDTLPGPKTPNSEFANKQIDSALATLKRVKPAVPNVKAQGAGANKPATGDLPPGWK
jgi:hypothetical protein